MVGIELDSCITPSSPRRSKLGCSIGHGMIIHSGNWGEDVVAWS